MNPAPFNITFTLYPGRGNDDERNKLRTKELVERCIDYLWAYDDVWLNLNLPKPTTRAEIANKFISPIKPWPLKRLKNGAPAPNTEWRHDQKLHFPEDKSGSRDACNIWNHTKSIPNYQELPPDQVKRGMWIGDIYYRYMEVWVRKDMNKERGIDDFKCGIAPLADMLSVFDDESSGIEIC